MNRLETVDIQKIRVQHRVRREIGSLQTLMESMREHGLLNPIVVTPRYELIAGQRRLEAAKRLGWRAIQCRVVEPRDRTQFLQIEIEENTARKDFNSDELADALVRLDRLKNPSWWKRLTAAFARAWEWLVSRFRRPPQP